MLFDSKKKDDGTCQSKKIEDKVQSFMLLGPMNTLGELN